MPGWARARPRGPGRGSRVVLVVAVVSLFLGLGLLFRVPLVVVFPKASHLNRVGNVLGQKTQPKEPVVNHQFQRMAKGLGVHHFRGEIYHQSQLLLGLERKEQRGVALCDLEGCELSAGNTAAQ